MVGTIIIEINFKTYFCIDILNFNILTIPYKIGNKSMYILCNMYYNYFRHIHIIFAANLSRINDDLC